ncbi:tyrosine-type recombinase/integrase [Parasedimentitalea huanghaiensis]|uniref:Tyrosine-type recombinase/integrase n=1 Tax=Parasedimentitalea huanghaiensis TaxID=2682100 RepID=A0A6L6W9N2_9RHOB|nr:site-specific integrase [Zongyanglinia huanghaiensis]MVO14523.1 tyrosine-type recombinase/integrase [Zongyanglinia huanghaiensis]
MKLLDKTECDSLKNCIDTNTSLAQLHEENVPRLGSIGKISVIEGVDQHVSNDRVIHDWLVYAGRYGEKTVDAHLASIRIFESFLDGKPFDRVSQKDAAAYRDVLVGLVKTSKESGGLGRSTIRHRASHLGKFFEWLRHQDGFRRLSGGIPDYFALPKGISAKNLQDTPKPYPTMEETIAMVRAMPHKTISERRDRAMVALTFVTGLRAGALTSLRLRHLDVEANEVVQDGTDMRAKNGKCFRVFWFPRTDEMQSVVRDWIAEMQRLGFVTRDAAFPACTHLTCQKLGHKPIDPMRTEGALSSAFSVASNKVGKSFSPHSARHCLASLGDSLCLTPERRKAWSLNLGHKTEGITETHYGKMSDGRRCEVIDDLRSREVWTEDEKDLMLDYFQCKLAHGSADFMRARKLARTREGSLGCEDVLD